MTLAEQFYDKASDDYRLACYCVANMMAFSGDTVGGGQLLMDVEKQYRDAVTSSLRDLPSEKRQPYLQSSIDLRNNMIPFGIEAQINEDELTEMA